MVKFLPVLCSSPSLLVCFLPPSLLPLSFPLLQSICIVVMLGFFHLKRFCPDPLFSRLRCGELSYSFSTAPKNHFSPSSYRLWLERFILFFSNGNEGIVGREEFEFICSAKKYLLGYVSLFSLLRLVKMLPPGFTMPGRGYSGNWDCFLQYAHLFLYGCYLSDRRGKRQRHPRSCSSPLGIHSCY